MSCVHSTNLQRQHVAGAAQHQSGKLRLALLRPDKGVSICTSAKMQMCCALKMLKADLQVLYKRCLTCSLCCGCFTPHVCSLQNSWGYKSRSAARMQRLWLPNEVVFIVDAASAWNVQHVKGVARE